MLERQRHLAPQRSQQPELFGIDLDAIGLVRVGVQQADRLLLEHHRQQDEASGANRLAVPVRNALCDVLRLRIFDDDVGAAIPVVAIPGPSAVTAALSVAGLPTDRFVFEGFLPRRSAARRERLRELAADSRTLVCFEAVHRIEATLADCVEIFGAGRSAALCRELTKLHEQVARGSLEELRAELGRGIPLLGEFVIVVEGRTAPAALDDAEVVRLYEMLVTELPPARAVALCAKITGRSRNAVYALTRA